MPKKWGEKQNQLKSLLSTGEWDAAIALAAEMHASIHESSGGKNKTYEDLLWEGLRPEICRIITKQGRSILWNIWHITRIEDLTANILIADGSQVLNGEWLERMRTQITDTGNAMTNEEVAEFSNEIEIEELRKYRREVGLQTRKILKKLKADDLKKKMRKDQLDRILSEGGVLNAADSVWLLDFWGRKTVSGLLTMPITRHQESHVNDSFKIKSRYNK
ncbi:DinB family protein [Brucepastera parasyntrophica]|uniref:DinB family protein n=1 Tax=Brucepastera parasyntrophica TaxID=2880008 RepID=UPI00210BAD2B|nr:DinB family protein [Brucepastera parasyntrophica]ULQ61144.1 DinB family protein [Brucepastera parasyntrophica]